MDFNSFAFNLLFEDSSFSKLFLDRKPIEFIHQVLNVKHNANIKLSETRNRNLLQDELRAGSALVCVTRDSIKCQGLLRDILKELKHAMPVQSYRAASKRINDYLKAVYAEIENRDMPAARINEIFWDIWHEGPNAKGAVQDVHRIQKKSLLETINIVYPGAQEQLGPTFAALKDALSINKVFVVKRIQDKSSVGEYENEKELAPNRQFTVARDDKEKIFGQKYGVWTFDDDKEDVASYTRSNTITGEPLNKKNAERYQNAKGVLQYVTKGMDAKLNTFYIVKDINFRHHASSAFEKAQSTFAKMLILDVPHVKEFATQMLTQYQQYFVSKIESEMKTQSPDVGIEHNSAQDAFTKAKMGMIENHSLLNNFNQFVLSDYIRNSQTYNVLVDTITLDAIKSSDFRSGAYDYAQQIAGIDQDDLKMNDVLSQKYGDYQAKPNAANRWKLVNYYEGLQTLRKGYVPMESSFIPSILVKNAKSGAVRTFKTKEEIPQGDITSNRFRLFLPRISKWVPLRDINKYRDVDIVFQSKAKNHNNPVTALGFNTAEEYTSFTRRYMKALWDDMYSRVFSNVSLADVMSQF